MCRNEEKVQTNKQECQANVYIDDDKNCQVNMQPVKLAVCDDKKCQSAKFYKNPVWSDKNFQDTKFMQPVPRPAKLQSEYKKRKSVCDDKNCQST